MASEENPLPKKDFRAQGKRNRAAGLRFETKVRANLEGMGWTVDKWTNTVDYEKLKLVPAKRKYNPFRKVMVMGTGFPDFIALRRIEEEEMTNALGEKMNSLEVKFEVVGVEVKMNGFLDREEKGMCLWLIENKVFSKILIAKKGEKRGEVEFTNFEKEYSMDDLKKKRKKASPLKKAK